MNTDAFIVQKVRALGVYPYPSRVRLLFVEFPLPSFAAQHKTATAVTSAIALAENHRKAIDLLDEMARTLMLNWTGRDPETGKVLKEEEG